MAALAIVGTSYKVAKVEECTAPRLYKKNALASCNYSYHGWIARTPNGQLGPQRPAEKLSFLFSHLTFCLVIIESYGQRTATLRRDVAVLNPLA